MPGPDSAASRTVEALAAYLSSPTAMRPDPAEPGAKLDGLVYWRINQIPGSGPSGAYEAFRRTPGSGELRAVVVEFLTGAMAADEGFASQLAAAVAAMPAGAVAESAAGAAATEPSGSGVEATQPSELPKWVPPADAPTMSAPIFPQQPGFSSQPGFGQPGQPWPPGPYPPQPRTGLTRRAWALITVGVLVLAGAGTGIVVATSSSNSGAGHYTYSVDPQNSPDGSFELLDWTTDSNGAVTGTVRLVDPADTTNNETLGFTGTQRGTDVTFVPNDDTLGGDLTGVLNDTTLVVTAPPGTTPGTATLTFQKTTATAFDQAVQQYEAQHPNGQTT